MHYSAKQITSKKYFFPGDRKILSLLWLSSLIPILIPKIFIPYIILLIYVLIYDLRHSNICLEKEFNKISFDINWPNFMELNRFQEITIDWNQFNSEFFLKIFLPAEFSPRIYTLYKSDTFFKFKGKSKGTYHDIEFYIGYQTRLGIFTRYRKLIHKHKIFIAPPILHLVNQEKKKVGRINQRYHISGESDFYGIRLYQFGDSLKNINWQKTAGSFNEIYVNEYQKEQNRKTLIILNTGISSRFDYKKYQYTDYQTALAFQLASTFIKNQDETGLLTFSDKIDLYIPPDLSKRNLSSIFKRLQRVEESYEHMNLMELYNFVKNKLQKKSILILLSPFLNFEQIYAQREVIYLLSKNYQIIWVNPIRLFKYYYENSHDLAYLWARIHLLKEKKSEDLFFKHNHLLYINDHPENLYQKIITNYFELKW